MIKKMLSKRRIMSLLKAFYAINPEISGYQVLDRAGQYIAAYPETLPIEIDIKKEHFEGPGRRVNLSDGFIASSFFVCDEPAGIIVAQIEGDAPPDRLGNMIQGLASVFEQTLILGLEKREVAIDALDKYREVTLMYTIGETISSCMDVDHIAGKVLEISQKFIRSEHSSVMLLDTETGTLGIKAAKGSERPSKTRLKEGFGVAGIVLDTGQPEIVNNPKEHPDFVGSPDQLRCLLCVPLKVQDKNLGVINISNKLYSDFFTAADEKLMMTLASQAAITIENANLVGELQKKNQALEAALAKVELLEKAKKHLSKFVPQSVQKLINDNPDNPELDKQEKHVSILFLDIAGYTKISESLDQEKVNHLIEIYFSSFLDDIHKNQGDINETAGDGLMIIFQNPDPKTHACQAARTALAIREKTERINMDLKDTYEPILVNIGINSGLASVGSVKIEGITGTRWTFTASGMVTNLAARIADFATSGSIVVSEQSAASFMDRFELDDLGERHFKNVKKPIHIFRLTGRKGEIYE